MASLVALLEAVTTPLVGDEHSRASYAVLPGLRTYSPAELPALWKAPAGS